MLKTRRANNSSPYPDFKLRDFRFLLRGNLISGSINRDQVPIRAHGPFFLDELTVPSLGTLEHSCHPVEIVLATLRSPF